MRALLALLVLIAALVAGTLLITERLADNETLRAGLTKEVRDELGLELELGDVDVGLLPPRIELAHSIVHFTDERTLEVAHAVFDVALMPLVTEARADVDTISVDGPLTFRTGGDGGPSATAVAAGQLTRRERDSFSLDLSGKLETEGDFELVGAKQRAETRLVLSIANVDPVPLVALFPAAAKRAKELEGRFDGRFELTSSAAEDRALTVAVHSPAAKLRAKDVIVDGPVEISATLDWAGRFPLGPFEIDATQANVGYALGMLRAATGQGAKLSGVLVEKKGSIRVADVRLSVSAFQAQIGGND